MKQISSLLITEIYASVIDFLLSIDFFIFFVIGFLVLPYQTLNSRIFFALQWLQTFECCLFFFVTKLENFIRKLYTVES